MPYDEELADRTREALAGTPGLTEKPPKQPKKRKN